MPLMTLASGRLYPLGTGFMISPNGLMMTAAHVIREVESIARKEATNALPQSGELYAL